MELLNENIVTERARTLRAELKKWEKEYSASNNGSKVSRDVIRQNPEIATKYKEYNKIREAQNRGQVDAQTDARSTPRKKKPEGVGHDANKQQKFLTPSKKRKASPEGYAPHESPSTARNIFTPSRISLGPTPQKDGLVLGMFDLLGDHENNDRQKPHLIKNINDGGLISVQDTPSKSPTKGEYTKLKVTMTPASSGKGRKRDLFSTPAKKTSSKKFDDKTPSSVSKFHLATPSFLRRDNGLHRLPCDLDKEEEFLLSPQTKRVHKRPAIKGLSSILAELRESQDEDLDKELEVLREIEAEESHTRKSSDTQEDKNKITFSNKEDEFIDSDVIHDKASFDNWEPDSFHQHNQSLKLYKKKGQKRTTRKVKMKPTPLIKPKPIISKSAEQLDTFSASSLERPVDNNTAFNDESNSNTAAATATETMAHVKEDQARNFDSDSQSEYTASEGETRYRRPDQEKNRRNKTATQQNFKRLKIRNSGAKGTAVRHGSRFRRKR